MCIGGNFVISRKRCDGYTKRTQRRANHEHGFGVMPDRVVEDFRSGLGIMREIVCGQCGGSFKAGNDTGNAFRFERADEATSEVFVFVAGVGWVFHGFVVWTKADAHFV
jgi:hypothetical protein